MDTDNISLETATIISEFGNIILEIDEKHPENVYYIP
jgi:hypothetical protein